MTFTEKEIKTIATDMEDEWQDDELTGLVYVKFYGLEEYVERFFNMRREVYTNSWIDGYAFINRKEQVVECVEFSCVYNAPRMVDRDLCIKLVPYEGKLFYKQLMETSNGGLQQFFDSLEEVEA